jgi:hypothetical protein
LPAAEHPAGVGLGGAADVVSLRIEDHQQPALLGVTNNVAERAHARRAKLFKERRLRLHHGHKRRDDVDHPAAEIEIRLRSAMQRIFAAGGDRPGQLLPPRIEADAHGVAALAYGFSEFIREVRHEQWSGLRWRL